ncbi:cupin domain-containing protein [Erythrobacter sp. 3-20A1M]|uniref:cupin domain-containing protein n=1 Tax=Erythrobacter sp. 3-20A1M TaxID=2653850 RepID=UPI00203F9A5B|nr:cupin domain-containing protein [Erythrobacter sp. 3-20A1M]
MPTVQDPVNLAAKFEGIEAHWAPRIVGQYNDNDIRIVRVEGEFVWHTHEETDDLFLVLEGRIEIELRDRTVKLGPGELFVVPRGVEHRPVARQGEAKLLIIEPSGTANTGDHATATVATPI